MSERLTYAQRRVLRVMSQGDELIRHFDVWGGYNWVLEPLSVKVRKSTVDALLRAKVIAEGNSERVFSGRQQMSYSLTDAGRAALAVSERDGGAR